MRHLPSSSWQLLSNLLLHRTGGGRMNNAAVATTTYHRTASNGHEQHDDVVVVIGSRRSSSSSSLLLLWRSAPDRVKSIPHVVLYMVSRASARNPNTSSRRRASTARLAAQPWLQCFLRRPSPSFPGEMLARALPESVHATGRGGKRRRRRQRCWQRRIGPIRKHHSRHWRGCRRLNRRTRHSGTTRAAGPRQPGAVGSCSRLGWGCWGVLAPAGQRMDSLWARRSPSCICRLECGLELLRAKGGQRGGERAQGGREKQWSRGWHLRAATSCTGGHG